MCCSFGKGDYAKMKTLQAKFQWLQKEVSDVVAIEIKLRRKLKELLKVCSAIFLESNVIIIVLVCVCRSKNSHK